jgi:phosphoglycerate dehydrogenase-like enzyme
MRIFTFYVIIPLYMEEATLEQITVLSLLKFTEPHLNKLRAVSPRLDVQQMTNMPFSEMPEALRNRVEILYSWGKLAADAHLFPQLKWLQTHSAGIDYLLDRPIWHSSTLVSSMNGIHSIQMAEHALAMMLAFRWKFPTMFRFQTKVEWPKGRWHIFSGPELRGSTLGLVGYGAIARELARQAQALGMRIVAVNRSGQRRPFEGFSEPGTGDPQATIPAAIYPTSHMLAMLPECDYVVVLAPLIPETHHFFNAGAFAAMKSSAVFFNLARGGLVDEPALIEALARQQIAGAGLDVFDREPLPPDSPLWAMENVLISPHVSGFTLKYDERATDLFAENLRRYLSGERLINQVERERGY